MTKVEAKKITARILFAGELLLFGWLYTYGAYGFIELNRLRLACDDIIEEKKEQVCRIKTLQQHIIGWNVHSFQKEKTAREKLHMARKDELIYLT